MNLLFEAAKEVCEFMEKRKWRFCIIGGLAVQKWGEPRTTLDADITLLTGWGEEEPFVSALLKRFEPRMEDGYEFALTHRVALIRASNGTDVDIALGALPFEEEMIQRSEKIEFAPGIELPCCTAEDLFIMKAFSGRSRDWVDAESIVTRQKSLDKKYISSHLSELCDLKESPQNFEKAKRLLEEKS